MGLNKEIPKKNLILKTSSDQQSLGKNHNAEKGSWWWGLLFCFLGWWVSYGTDSSLFGQVVAKKRNIRGKKVRGGTAQGV